MIKKIYETRDINMAALGMTLGFPLDKEAPLLSFLDDQGRSYYKFFFDNPDEDNPYNSTPINDVANLDDLFSRWKSNDDSTLNIVTLLKNFIHNRNILLDMVKKPTLKVVSKQMNGDITTTNGERHEAVNTMTFINPNATEEAKKALIKLL